MSTFESGSEPFIWSSAVHERDDIGARIDALSYMPPVEFLKYREDTDPATSVASYAQLSSCEDFDLSIAPLGKITKKAGLEHLYIVCRSLLRPEDTVTYAVSQDSSGVRGYAIGAFRRHAQDGPVLLHAGRTAAVLEAASKSIEFATKVSGAASPDLSASS